MQEPGLDRHEWQSEWASLEEDFDADPFNSLRYVHELIGRMLKERGILDDSFVATEGADPELLRPYEAGAELIRRIDSELDVEDADVREALENYRELFETLVTERAPP
ncbi:MAG: hypothetical protein ACRDKK_05370 [Gaiellaceae bacterium]